MNQGTKVVIGLVGLVVLVLLVSVWIGGPSDGNLAAVGGINNGEANTPGSNAPLAQSVTFRVNDQFPGRVALISSAVSPAGGWVVIKKDQAGQPGVEIGRKFFSPTETIGNVDLTEATVEGNYYWASFQTETGTALATPIRFYVTRDLPEQKG